MKEKTAMADEVLPVQTFDTPGYGSNINSFSYARVLRALGQDLEAHNLSSLDLEVDAGLYVVRGKVRASEASELSFARVVRDLISNFSFASGQSNSSSRTEIGLRYSPKDIEQLESQGRAKRKESHHMPDPYSLSQILRGAGSYLDKRTETYLVEITIADQWTILRYKTADGQVEQMKQDVEYFYNYWVKMYLHRSNRPKLPPSNDSSLIVEWDMINERLRLTPSQFSNFS
jgi:hypothetical protein